MQTQSACFSCDSTLFVRINGMGNSAFSSLDKYGEHCGLGMQKHRNSERDCGGSGTSTGVPISSRAQGSEQRVCL